MAGQCAVNRRDFIKAVGIAAAGAGMAEAQVERSPAAQAPKQSIRKAVNAAMVEGSMPLLDKFKLLKEIGFDGVEINCSVDPKREEVLRARDESGLPIHGVVDGVHWKDTLSHPDGAVRARGVEGLKSALRDAKAYGATSVLLVPAKVEKDVPYDQAYVRSQAEIRKAIPLAEELGIMILVENVWNNFLLSPLEMARYIDELASPMVRAYFDVGNIVRIGWPEHWIRILGPRIVKIHVKEYSRKKQQEVGLWKGFDVELLEGDCDWPAVMAALREIKFSGWATAEVPGGDRARLTSIAERMDRALGS